MTETMGLTMNLPNIILSPYQEGYTQLLTNPIPLKSANSVPIHYLYIMLYIQQVKILVGGDRVFRQ